MAHDYIQGFQKIYKDLAAQYHLTLIPFLLADIVTPDLRYFQRDGIHPDRRRRGDRLARRSARPQTPARSRPGVHVFALQSLCRKGTWTRLQPCAIFRKAVPARRPRRSFYPK